MQFDIELPITITIDKINWDSAKPSKVLYSLDVKSKGGQISTDPIYSDSPEELFNRLFKILIDNKIYTPQQ